MESTAESTAIITARVQEQRARAALTITRVVVWIAIVVSLMSLGIWLFSERDWRLLVLTGLFVFMLGQAWLYPRLYRRGRGALGVFLFLFSGWLVISSFPAILPPLLLAVMGDCIILAAMGYQLMENRYGHVLSLLCVVSLIGNFVLVEVLVPNWLTSPAPPFDWIIGLLFGASTLVVAVLIIFSIIKGQERSFRDAQVANLEVEKRVVAELEQRKLLQQANVEIEKRMAVEKEQRQQLQRLLAQTQEVVNRLTSAAAEILATTSQQATGASEQSAAIAQASATIVQVRSIAEQTSQRVVGVADLAQRTLSVSQAGQAAAVGSVRGMEAIRQRVETIAQNILALSEQAQVIGQIITTVNEISTKSNMLALNAAVEAARAGESGKGFAVVAAEVRALAEQSRAATLQVREILTEIQRGVNTAVMTTEEGMKEAGAGIRLVEESGRAIERLIDSVTSSVQAAEQISAAAGQQLSGMEQIDQAMQSIHQVTEQTVAGARQVEQTAAELNALSGQLRELLVQEMV